MVSDMAAVFINRCTVCKEKEILTRAFSGDRGGIICQECKITEERIKLFLNSYNFMDKVK
jgi:hypothetical protein